MGCYGDVWNFIKKKSKKGVDLSNLVRYNGGSLSKSIFRPLQKEKESEDNF